MYAMRIPSMDEVSKRIRARRPALSADRPFIYRDSKEWRHMSKDGVDRKAYYMKIYEWLSPLQKLALAQHASDIAKGPKIKHPIRTEVTGSSTYQLLRSAKKLGLSVLITLAGSPFYLVARPLDTIYMTVWFGTIYSGLFLANIAFLIGHILGIGNLVRSIAEQQGSGWSVINWLDIDIFNGRTSLFEDARDAFSSDLPDFEPVIKPNELRHKRRKLEFNVDIARSMLLMCAIVYERDMRAVKKAASPAISKPSLDVDDRHSKPTESVLLLLKSEEYMYRLAADWGLHFISIADFRGLTGPYAGAFYNFENIGPHENPFVVVVLKGTSPDNFSEWLIDCACEFESCGDFLGTGHAHSGFYNALFPSKASGARVLPYMRIVETIRMIAAQAAAHTEQVYGAAKKTNLFIGGHSLGAGMAQLLYARFLESPEDLGSHVVLRDGYVFGTPRACDYKLASRVEANLNKPINQGRQLWRVVNRARAPNTGDIVTRVPPGLADQRGIRSELQEGSYYAYAAIGTMVALTPNASAPPFYGIEDLPIGYGFKIYKKCDEADNDSSASREASKYIFPRDIVQLSMWFITVFLPVLHDHFPASYMDSLCKMQVTTPKSITESRLAQRRGSSARADYGHYNTKMR